MNDFEYENELVARALAVKLGVKVLSDRGCYLCFRGDEQIFCARSWDDASNRLMAIAQYTNIELPSDKAARS